MVSDIVCSLVFFVCVCVPISLFVCVRLHLLLSSLLSPVICVLLVTAVGMTLQLAQQQLLRQQRLYICVSTRSAHAQIEFNFGQKPFQFNLQTYCYQRGSNEESDEGAQEMEYLEPAFFYGH